MLQAQEMFNNSNKLTRPEKALILGFIAGSRGLYCLINLFIHRYKLTSFLIPD